MNEPRVLRAGVWMVAWVLARVGRGADASFLSFSPSFSLCLSSGDSFISGIGSSLKRNKSFN
jgi:hypothetical protein